MAHIDAVTQALSPLIQRIQQHPLYEAIHSLAHLRIFMEHHVFAVWDFMCLLKELHRRVVSTQAPWFPPKDAYCANLINQILVGEEGDVTEDGQYYLSHFELYLAAMQKIGANIQPIQNFLQSLASGASLFQAAKAAGLSFSIRQFMQTTFSFFDNDTPVLAAAFVYGREAITASLFTPLLQRITQHLPAEERAQTNGLNYYLHRHIQLDQADHLPKALCMLTRLTPETPSAWQNVQQAAHRSLEARIDFLSGIQMAINANGIINCE